MKLWLITQEENNGYDTFDSAVVAAENEDEAKKVHPEGRWEPRSWHSAWASSPEKVTAKEIGVADASIQPGVVLASFNAG